MSHGHEICFVTADGVETIMPAPRCSVRFRSAGLKKMEVEIKVTADGELVITANRPLTLEPITRRSVRLS